MAVIDGAFCLDARVIIGLYARHVISIQYDTEFALKTLLNLAQTKQEI